MLFTEKISTLEKLAQSCDKLKNQTDAAAAENSESRKAVKCRYQTSLKANEDLRDNLDAVYTGAADDRTKYIRDTTDKVNKMLDEVEDPHFHRMAEFYYEKYKTATINVDRFKSGNQLQKVIEEKINELKKELYDLKYAFFNPEFSGIIGLGMPSFRANMYRRITTLVINIFACLDRLEVLDDLNNIKERNERERKSESAKLRENCENELSLLPGELAAKREELKQVFLSELKSHKTNGAFDGEASIRLGAFYYKDDSYTVSRAFSEDLSEYVNEYIIYFPASVSGIGENVLFSADRQSHLSETFSSYALDILKSSPDAEIYFADAEGLGSNYSALTALVPQNKVHIWKTDDEIKDGLKEISRWIGEATAMGIKSPEKYIFAENIELNICERDMEQFCRVIKNGNKAGVYTVMSISSEFVPERQYAEYVDTIRNNSRCFDVRQNRIPSGERGSVVLSGKDIEKKVKQVYEICLDNTIKKKIIPLEAVLPKQEFYHTKSSADGIEIPIGVDCSGNEIKMVISEEKPYAMIVGDVDVGKSSLLHNIIIQILTNYDSSQVKIAVGDFKMGAEFNIYASSGLESADAVVSNEDPDVMASFLRYYVTEMRRRQMLFAEVAEKSGKLVRKYETYRKESEKMGCGEILPRIIIVIDEFQSLFESGAETALLMNHLVRKARTYGIHIIMASQRAINNLPQNTFTNDLKDFFTSRFVLRCPQTAARVALSERCADTGKENTGIAAASLLKKGHAIYNSYMGQTERDNCIVQCYYASDETVSGICERLKKPTGTGNSILLKGDAVSVKPKYIHSRCITFGMSPCLHVDASGDSDDIISDDTFVSLRTDIPLENIIVSGPDVRVAESLTESVCAYIRRNGINGKIHVFGTEDSMLVRGFMQKQNDMFEFHLTPEEQTAELEAQLSGKRDFFVNVFCEPENQPHFVQSFSSMRPAPEAELYKKVLALAKNSSGFCITYTKHFKNIKNDLPYAVMASPIRLTGVGDAENMRFSLSENCHFSHSEFDISSRNAIKAYYFNKNTEKIGKVIMFAVT